MAGYGNPGPEEDMYGDSQVAAPSGPEGEAQQDSETTLVPKSICPGMKVGDEMVLKIVGDREQDWEVAYAPKEGSKEEEAGESPAEESQEQGGGGEMRGMMY